MKYIIPTMIIIMLGCTSNVDQDVIVWEKLNPSAEKTIAKVVEFEKNDQLDSAIRYIYKADDEHPNHPYVLHKKALILSNENNYLGTALIDMDKSIKLTTDNKLRKIRYNDRGIIYYKMGEIDRALNDWVKAEKYGAENIKKHGFNNKELSIVKLPEYYSFGESSRAISLFDVNFPENAFHEDGGLLRGKHIIFTQKPKAGALYELVDNSNVLLIPRDSSVYLNKMNDTTFDLFIPRSYSEKLVSYDVYIAPHRGYHLVTYFTNRLITYPDTLHLHLKNMLVHNN
jgi:tetratricopeptide (TPR) repeat protein